MCKAEVYPGKYIRLRSVPQATSFQRHLLLSPTLTHYNAPQDIFDRHDNKVVGLV